MKLFGQQREVRVSMADLQEELNNLFSRLYHGGLATRPLDGQDWAPRLDLIEEPQRYLIRAEIPGVSLPEVEVSVLGTTVSIKGHKPPPELEPKTARLIFGETRSGSFHRQVSLPQEVDPEQVTASGGDGVLILSLPKTEPSQPRSVPIEIRPG